MTWRTRRDSLNQLDEDIRDHIERETANNIARGMAPDAAHAAARRAFGNVTRTKEATRAVWIPIWVDQFLQDVRYAIRMFRRTPGFTAVVILTLALGIGLNTAVFSVVNAVLMRPLSYQHPERLVWIATYDDRAPDLEMVAAPDFLAWRSSASSIERIAAFSIGTERIAGRDEVVPVRVANVSHEFWDLTGGAPALGRLPTPQEDAVVLSHAFFERAFAADPSVVGRAVAVNGRPVIVAGVLAPSFRAELPPPVSASQLRRGDVDAYHATAVRAPLPNDPGVRLFSVVARLKPGVALERVTAELAAIRANRVRTEGLPDKPRLRVVPYTDKLVGAARTPLLILQGAVLIVLTIAAANIANLLLARASARRREIAIRVAVGAGRSRVLRQFIVESLALALAGGAAGLLVARGGQAVMLRLIPYALPRLSETRTDSLVLGFAAAVSVATAFVFGVIPAIAVMRFNPRDTLKSGAAAGTHAGLRARRALVVTEIALASVLLVGAALMIKSLWRITAPPPGLSPEHVLTMQFQPSQRRDYISEIIRRAQAVPGVQAAGMSSNGDVRTMLQIEGAPELPMNQRPRISLSAASAGYASAIGMRVVKGRWFAEHEPEPACVVNESLARRHFPGQDPVGRRLFVATGPSTGELAAIVGIVADLHYSNLEAPIEPEVFVHYERVTPFGMNLAVRTAADPMAIAPALRAALVEIDRTRPIVNIRTLETVLNDSVAPRRFNVFLLATFAATALLLALIGIYGVMAYSVAQRTHEIGVRMALGAERGAVVAMVVRQGLTLAFAGIGLGVAAALALTRVIAGLLYEVTPTDPTMFAIAMSALALAALAACAGPALRASLVNPIVALRCD